jgi:hypothetical protein
LELRLGLLPPLTQTTQAFKRQTREEAEGGGLSYATCGVSVISELMNCVVSWISKWQGKDARSKIKTMQAWKISEVENNKFEGGCNLQNTFPSELLEEAKDREMSAFKNRASITIEPLSEVVER